MNNNKVIEKDNSLNNNETVRKDYFSIVWQGKWLALATSLIAVFIISSITFVAPRSFQSSFILTLKGRSLISVTTANMRSPYTNSAYLADIINEPYFSTLVFSEIKSSNRQGSFLDLLSGKQIKARADTDTNIVYGYTYGRTAAEAKDLADKTIEKITGQIITINTKSSQNIRKNITNKVLKPLVKEIDELGARIEKVRAKKTDKTKINTEVMRLQREITALENKRAKFDEYVIDMDLFDTALGPRLSIVMEPVVSGLPKANFVMQIISSALIGLMFGVFFVLIKGYVKDSQINKENDKPSK